MIKHTLNSTGIIIFYTIFFTWQKQKEYQHRKVFMGMRLSNGLQNMDSLQLDADALDLFCISFANII